LQRPTITALIDRMVRDGLVTRGQHRRRSGVNTELEYLVDGRADRDRVVSWAPPVLTSIQSGFIVCSIRYK
jgi:DNA-binding MarR family transcriptional regulator